MNRLSPGVSCAVLLGFFAGFLVHLLYQRWNPAPEQQQPLSGIEHASSSYGSEPGIYRVSFVPLAPAAEEVVADLPTLVAREVEITGFIKDHPQYGLEVVIEDPKQIKLMN